MQRATSDLVYSVFIPFPPLRSIPSRISHTIPNRLKALQANIKNMPSSSTNPTALKAEYTAPASSKQFSHTLPSCTTKSTREKTAYLSALRTSVTRLQDEVNVFLTEKMEEDKTLAALVGVKGDDRKDEENYGEEVVDESG